MIDFSTLQGLTIPEGNVSKIEDAQGNVLWSAAPKGVTVTIIDESRGGDGCKVIIDGTTYTSAATVTVPIGTVIKCQLEENDDGSTSIRVNGSTVVSGSGSSEYGWDGCEYDYVVLRDTTVKLVMLKSSYIDIEPASYITKPVVLEVEKITSDTYAGETTYTGEQFILLDIYPQAADSVVNVTYGGLTKTLTFSGGNAQSVYFGTFNGASDSVATPTSGTLTIEGDYDGFSTGTYKQYSNNKSVNKSCGCITGVNDFGSTLMLTKNAFYSCAKLMSITLPKNLVGIDSYAFNDCTGLTNITIPESVAYMGISLFGNCTGLTNVNILATAPPYCLGSTFLNTTCTITVPAGCGEAYKTASGWSAYADRIVEAS